MRLANHTHLYCHPDSPVAYKEGKEKSMALVGYIFNPWNIKQCAYDILSDLIEEAADFDQLIFLLKPYVGHYALIYIDETHFNVVNDPLALREIYFVTSENLIICGSQPNSISLYSSPRLPETRDPVIRRFFLNDMKKVRNRRFWVGDETYYDGIKHLLPNHYLDVNALKVRRYWPRQKLGRLPLNEVVLRSCAFLKNALKAASIKNNLMIAVTAGNDSRTLLAASKDISDRIYYFINKQDGMDDDHPDIRIPKAMFTRIGLPFHIHDVRGSVPDDFRRVFLANTFLSNDLLIETIYNVYYKNHSHRMNVLGVGEIGRAYFGTSPKSVNGYLLARSLKFKDSRYAVEKCQEWLDAALPVARVNGINVMTLLLWEQLLGNWGAVGNSESDIAIEEFDPYDSHYLYETLLGLDENYLINDESRLVKEMIKHMWPELLEFPINPPSNKNERLIRILKHIGVYSRLKTLTYKIDEMLFNMRRREVAIGEKRKA